MEQSICDTLFTCVRPAGWLWDLCVLATVVRVWREIFSHVEGVVGRQHRVWMTERPLAPSPVVLVVLSEH